MNRVVEAPIRAWTPEEDGPEEEQRAKDNARAVRKLHSDLVKLRIDRGMTQEQVGALLGMSQSSVSQFESRGNDPRLSTIRKYALAVGARLVISVDKTESRQVITTERFRVHSPARSAPHTTAYRWADSERRAQ